MEGAKELYDNVNHVVVTQYRDVTLSQITQLRKGLC